MTAVQVTAFNSSSGTTVNEVQLFILTLLFSITCIWAVVMLWGKLAAFKKQQEIDAIHIMWSTLRILAVVVVVLFLVNF